MISRQTNYLKGAITKMKRLFASVTTSDINWNIFTIDEIVVTNNTLETGVYTVAGADDWCNLDMAILRKVE